MQLLQIDQPLPVLPVQHRPYRSGGVHASVIIHDLCLQLDPERFSHAKDREGEELEWIGTELEEHPKIWLGSAVDRHFDLVLEHSPYPSWRPGEIVLDGIAMSADHLALEPARAGLLNDNGLDPIVEEIKLTWMTMSVSIEDKRFWHWFAQIKAYSWAYETLRARLRVVFVNGGYTRRIRLDGKPMFVRSPQGVVYDLLFAYEECRLNWEMLLRHRDTMRREGRL